MTTNILRGFRSYFKAFFLVSELKLWRYLITPILVALFILAVIIVPLWAIYSISKGFLGFWESETAHSVLFEVAHYTEIIIFFIFGKILYKHIAMAVLSPIMSPVSLKIEAHVYGNTKQHIKLTFMQSLWRGLRINTRNFIREMIFTSILLLISFIPYIGVIAAVMLFIIHAYYAGFGNMDPTLERHFNYKNSIRFVKQHRGIAIGNGIVFLLILFVPIVGLIIAYPISFIAASVVTLETLYRETEDEKSKRKVANIKSS